MEDNVMSLAEAEKIGFDLKTRLRIIFKENSFSAFGVSEVSYVEFSSVSDLRDTIIEVINSRILEFDDLDLLDSLSINQKEVDLKSLNTDTDYFDEWGLLFKSYDYSYLMGIADTDFSVDLEFRYDGVANSTMISISLSKFEYDRVRGFDLVSKYASSDYLLPERSTSGSAGYDLRSAEEVTLQPKEIKLIPLGVKAYMQPNEVLYLYDRSSNPRKKGLVTINSVGIIDSDYYGNPDNEGLIYAQMMNITDEPITVDVGERLVQGIFMNFLTADGDSAKGARVGGFGSTGS